MTKLPVTLPMVFLFCLRSLAQITNPAPYCNSTFDHNYNMFNKIIVKGYSHSFGEMGSVFALNTYKYYNSTTFPDLIKSDTVSLQIEVFAVNDAEPGYFALWIDYNHNNSFDNSELVMQNSNTTNNFLPTWGQQVTPVNKVITIPATALTGVTRARLMRGTDVDDPFGAFNSGFSLQPCAVTTGTNFGCTYDFDINIVNSITSIAPSGNNNNFSISPNPTSNFLFIKTEQEKITGGYTLSDNAGKVLLQSNSGIPESLDLTLFSPGVYFLKIKSGNKVYTHKIVKN